jgi:hypothetical protein
LNLKGKKNFETRIQLDDRKSLETRRFQAMGQLLHSTCRASPASDDLLRFPRCSAAGCI